MVSASRLTAVCAIALGTAMMPIASADAQTGDQVRCSFNYAPDKPCRMSDNVVGDVHHMKFTAPGVSVSFVAKSQSGWWAGRLNGKPAMAFERNQGNVVISSYDLSTNFAWWYPKQAHGTY